MADVLLEVKNLVKNFTVKKGFLSKTKHYVHAVEDVSFNVFRGETFGIVGESGSGKTTVGRTILQLYKPTSGEVIFEGTNLADLAEKDMRLIRKKMQIIFQDPYASLNPKMTIGSIISEPLKIFDSSDWRTRKKRVGELLEMVGLNPRFTDRYPHEFSGGQRQRVGIARALALNPSLIICDEPISALDVSIQAQVLNLLEDLQKQLNLTYIFIAHDLSMVRHISNRVAVMYLGSIVEIGDIEDVYESPKHPYTKALLSAIPEPNPKEAKSHKRIILEGDIPSPITPPSGCCFRTRCNRCMDRCSIDKPMLKQFDNKQYVACFLYE